MSADHFCTIEVSKDRSLNYGAATIHDIGGTGRDQEAIRRRLGNSRQFVLRVTVTSPRGRDVIAMAIQADRES